MLKKSIVNDIGLDDENSIVGLTNKITPNSREIKLDKVALRIFAVTYNMAGGLPES
jgi:hypothetical protein